MTYEINYIAQVCDSVTHEVIEEKLLKTKTLPFPTSFQKFGLRHQEQIALIKSSQDLALKYQCSTFGNISKCPKCGK